MTGQKRRRGERQRGTPVVAVLLLCLGGAAEAARGRGPFERAMHAYQAGDYRRAAARFEAILARRDNQRGRARPAPAAVLHYNLGECYRRLGELRRSHGHYAAYARTLPAARRAELTARLERLRFERPAKASITTTPGDALVLIDGKERGRTPTDGSPLLLDLAGGRRALRIERPGYRTHRRALVVEFGEPLPLSFALRPAPVTLDVRTPVRGARIVVDGTDRGGAPARLRLPPGEHDVEVHKRGHETYARRIKLAPGGDLTLRAPLRRVGSAGAQDVSSGSRDVSSASQDRTPPGQTARTRTRGWAISGVVLAVGSAAALAVGVGFNLEHNDRYESSPELGRLKAAGIAGYVGAGALAAGSALCWYLHLRSRARRPNTAVGGVLPLAGGALATGQVRF